MMEQYGMDIKQCPGCKQQTLQLLKIHYTCLAGRQILKLADDG
jgi:hypothetical protein